MPRTFLTEGCEKAFNCGKEFVIAGLDPFTHLQQALTFCDTVEEEVFFIRGCAEEARDLEELVDDQTY